MAEWNDIWKAQAAGALDPVDRACQTALSALADQRDSYREQLERMADTLRGVLVAAESDPPYPWSSGALKQQIREDITAYELLGLDVIAMNQKP